MMETEQIVFKTPSKRKKNERGASMKHAKKADREIVQTESDAESDMSDTSVPIAAINNVTNKEYSDDEVKQFLKATKNMKMVDGKEVYRLKKIVTKINNQLSNDGSKIE
ncbi:uncharacterized [Tachysurus ichikawai]